MDYVHLDTINSMNMKYPTQMVCTLKISNTCTYINPKKVLRREVSILNKIKEICSQIFGILAFIKKQVERSNYVTTIFCTDIKSTQNNDVIQYSGVVQGVTSHFRAKCIESINSL